MVIINLLILDVTQRTPEQKIYGLTIGIAASVTFLVVIIAICVLIIVIIVCLYQKKELRRKHKGKEDHTRDKLANIREDLDNAANFRSPEALNKTVLDKLKKIGILCSYWKRQCFTWCCTTGGGFKAHQ